MVGKLAAVEGQLDVWTLLVLDPNIYSFMHFYFKFNTTGIDKIICSGCSNNNIFQFRQCLFFTDEAIFRHLKLEIASAIPASNEWKIETQNSASHGLIVIQYVAEHPYRLHPFSTSTLCKWAIPGREKCAANILIRANKSTKYARWSHILFRVVGPSQGRVQAKLQLFYIRHNANQKSGKYHFIYHRPCSFIINYVYSIERFQIFIYYWIS